MIWHRRVQLLFYGVSWLFYISVIGLMIYSELGFIAGVLISFALLFAFKPGEIRKEVKGRKFSNLSDLFPIFQSFSGVEVANHNRDNCCLYDFPFGRTIVCLPENVSDRFEKHEMNAIVGHELGHYYYGDTIFKLALIPFILGFAALTYLNPVGLIGVVLLLLAANFYSRCIEVRADLYSVQALEEGDSLLSALAKMEPFALYLFDESNPYNLILGSGLIPSFMIRTHPTYTKRYKTIVSFCNKFNYKQELTRKELEHTCRFARGKEELFADYAARILGATEVAKKLAVMPNF